MFRKTENIYIQSEDHTLNGANCDNISNNKEERCQNQQQAGTLIKQLRFVKFPTGLNSLKYDSTLSIVAF